MQGEDHDARTVHYKVEREADANAIRLMLSAPKKDRWWQDDECVTDIVTFFGFMHIVEHTSPPRDVARRTHPAAKERARAAIDILASTTGKRLDNWFQSTSGFLAFENWCEAGKAYGLL